MINAYFGQFKRFASRKSFYLYKIRPFLKTSKIIVISIEACKIIYQVYTKYCFWNFQMNLIHFEYEQISCLFTTDHTFRINFTITTFILTYFVIEFDIFFLIIFIYLYRYTGFTFSIKLGFRLCSSVEIISYDRFNGSQQI